MFVGDARLIADVCISCGLSRRQAAYVLATAEWETAHTLKPVREAFWLSDAWRRKNLRYYPWYGRGYVQLTWRNNYARAQEKLGLGTLLTDTPDAALRSDIAVLVLVRGMMEGWFTGKRLDEYVNDLGTDYYNARRVVNGLDKANEIAALAEEWYDVLSPGVYAEQKTTGGRHVNSIIKWLTSVVSKFTGKRARND